MVQSVDIELTDLPVQNKALHTLQTFSIEKSLAIDLEASELLKKRGYHRVQTLRRGVHFTYFCETQKGQQTE